MNKVYISKTFDSSVADFDRVMDDLKAAGIEPIVFEKGTKYSQSIIDPANMIITIAPVDKLNLSEREGLIIVKASKGIHTEHQHGLRLLIPSYLFVPDTSTYHKIVKNEVIDETSWKGHYGNLYASGRVNTVESLAHIIDHGDETEDADEDPTSDKPSQNEIDGINEGSMA